MKTKHEFAAGDMVIVKETPGDNRPVGWISEMDGLQGRVEVCLSSCGCHVSISDTRDENDLGSFEVPTSAISKISTDYCIWLKHLPDQTAEKIARSVNYGKIFTEAEAVKLIDEVTESIENLAKQYPGIHLVLSVGAATADGLQAKSMLRTTETIGMKIVHESLVPATLPSGLREIIGRLRQHRQD